MSLDYRKTLESLQRLNSSLVDGKPLNHLFLHDNYDFWGIYQMSLFSDLKRISGKDTAVKKYFGGVKDFLLKSFLLLESLFAILLKKPDIFLFALDKTSSSIAMNDSRMDDVYRFLKKENISYVEIMHTIPSRQTIKNFIKRKRLVIYLESFSFFLSQRHLDGIEPLVAKYDYRFSLSKRLIKLFTFLFKWKHPKALWGIDDTRNIHELVIAAKKANLVSYLFQHGHFTKYHVGWLKYNGQIGRMPNADHLVVWNEYWKKELIDLGTYYPEDAIMVGGSKYLEKQNTAVPEKISVIIPYETDAPKNEVRGYIEKMNNEGFNVYLKIRKDISTEKQIEEYGGKNCVIAVESFVPAHACLGVYSSFLYDVIGIYPVGLLKTSMDYGYGMVKNQLAKEIVLDIPIMEQIKNMKISSFGDQKVLLYDTLFDITKKCGIL